MASLDSVKQKFQRAKIHRDELHRELVSYYESNPGNLFETPESTPEHRLYEFREKKPIPAHFGLICGDCLQCLRSSLDYLVWELVEAAGKPTHKQLMFPVSLIAKDYKSELTKRHRLDGVDPTAISIIDTLQPCVSDDPERSPLAMLDALTNLNKHRRIILTSLAGTIETIPESSPCIIGIIGQISSPDGQVNEFPMSGCMTIQDCLAKDIEIIHFLDMTAFFISQQILPLFKKFFK
jgi:hypothetical protein